MPRRIPWETSPIAPPAPRSRKAPAAKPAAGTSDKNPLSPLNATASASPIRANWRKRERTRTPSTSPPPAPPATEYMTGDDDIYLLVEDEFLSVAQEWTKCLHHAEYVRLKKKAKEKAKHTPLERSDAGASAQILLDHARPETRKRIQGQTLHKKQAQAVAKMTNGEAEAEAESEDAKEEPWKGTTLGALMSGGLGIDYGKRTALVSLQGIPSSTRASHGFARSEADSHTAEKRSTKGILDMFEGQQGKAQKNNREENKTLAVDVDECGKNNYHLDPAAPPAKTLGRAEPDRRQAESSACSTASQNPPRKHRPVPNRSVIANFDEFDSAEIPVQSTRSKAKDKDKKGRLNEVPTFLI